eukprot:symbB.v1.2.017583.t1/scaffold1330.1/size125110/1
MRNMAVSTTKLPMPVEFYTKPAPSVPVRTVHSGYRQAKILIGVSHVSSTVIAPAPAASPNSEAHAASSPRPVRERGSPQVRRSESESASTFRSNLQRMEGGSTSRGKLDYIIASCSSLRRRLERSQRPEQVQQMLQEVKKLSADLQPILTLFNEFKTKWEVQKRQLLQQKRAEIDAFLRDQDEQASRSFAKTAEAELAEFGKTKASAFAAKELEDLLRKSVEEWRGEVHGAELVKPSDVEKVMRMLMQRVEDWTSQQEEKLLTMWKEMLRPMLTELHRLDLGTFQTLEGKLLARRQIVDDMLQRQRHQLAQATKQMQETLTQKSLEMLAPDREEQRKRDKKAERRLLLKEAHLAASQRGEAAKNEGLKALQAQLSEVLFELDRRAAKLLLKRSVLQEAMTDQEAPLASALEEELQRRLEQLKRHSVRRVSADTALAVGDRSPGARSDDEKSEAQIQLEVARERSRMTSELSQLRSEVKTLLSSLGQGRWGLRPWTEDIHNSAKEKMEHLQDAKAALEIQDQILQKAEINKSDEQWLKEVVTALAASTKDFQEELRPKFEAVAGAKKRLWEQRQGFLTAAAKREQQHLAEAEAEVLRHVAKLVPEAEAMAELGRALRSQPAALPLVLVAGSWRRAVQHALPLLLRLWELAGTTKEEQREFLGKLKRAEIRPKAEARPRQEVKPRKERSPPWPQAAASSRAAVHRAKANSCFQEVLSPRRPPETPRRGGAVRPESPHDCISNRSRSPDIDGVITMRRSGAGKSSGGGPSSICLGDERPLQRAVSAEPRLKQSPYDTFDTVQERRRSDGLTAEARESDFRDFERCESPRVPCETPRQRQEASHWRREAWKPRNHLRIRRLIRIGVRQGWPDYDELAAENWQLRQEVRQLRSELEKCATNHKGSESEAMEERLQTRWMSIFLLSLSGFGFSIQALLVRWLTEKDIGIFQLLLLRGSCEALGCCLCLRGKPLETWLGTTPLEWKVLFVRALLAYSVLCFSFTSIALMPLAIVTSDQIITDHSNVFF